MGYMRTLADIHLAVACPMANEGKNGVRFVAEVLEACKDVGRVNFYAVVDHANRDNTRTLLNEYAQADPRLTVVWAPDNQCIADAYIRGYREALASGADWILEIDAGFSHKPREIPQFFPPMLQGCDAVFGSRFMKNGGIENSSLKRHVISWGGTALTNLLIGTRLHDMTSGFEMFTRGTLEWVLEKGIHSKAHFFQTEIKIHCRNLKVMEVPIHYEMASARLPPAPVLEAFQQLWRLFALRVTGRLDSRDRSCTNILA